MLFWFWFSFRIFFSPAQLVGSFTRNLNGATSAGHEAGSTLYCKTQSHIYRGSETREVLPRPVQAKSLLVSKSRTRKSTLEETDGYS